MKTSISNDMMRRRQDRSWTKAVARSLRDWLNGYLEEAAGTTDDAQVEDRGSATLSARTPDIEEEEEQAVELSVGEEQFDPLLTSLFEPAGPPEEWLKMVREGAPQLLLPAEKGGAPWHGSPTAATRIDLLVEKKDGATGESPKQISPVEAMRIERPIEGRREANGDGPPVPSSSMSAASKTSPTRSEEPQVSKRNSARSTNASESTWIQRVKRQFAAGVLSTERKTEKSQHLSSAKRVHCAEKTKPSQEVANDVSEKPPAAPRFSDVEPAPFPAAKGRDLVTPQSRPTSPSTRRAERALPTIPTNRTTPQIRRETNAVEVDFPRDARVTTPASPFISKVTDAMMRGSGETDHAVSRPSVRFHKIEETSISRRGIEGDFDSSPRNIETLTSRPGFPLPPDTRGHHETASQKTMATPDSSPVDWTDLPATKQVENLWPRISVATHEAPESSPRIRVVQEQKTYRDDPWPELPENQPTVAPAWMPELRGERLCALDLEQRGGS
jgi:hypothetical protein